jgi:hypothetical protein
MDKRCEAEVAGNRGMGTFCKMCMNGSYGYDGMNTEKYTTVKLRRVDERQDILHDNYVSGN